MWHYRVIETTKGSDTFLGIHVVHYDDDGWVEYVAENPAKIIWTAADGDGKEILKMMALAFDKPVLKASDFE